MEPVRTRIAVPAASFRPPRLRAAGVVRRFAGALLRAPPVLRLQHRRDRRRLRGERRRAGPRAGDIKVELEGRSLTIWGETKAEEEGGDGYRRRSFGSVHRSLRLPEGVDADSITASCENGVLTVTIPKPEAARAKAIEVKVA